jgi:ADP-ribose pyrophosphatase
MTNDKNPDFTETTISSKTVYRGKLLHVLEDEVRLPDGKHMRREYIRHPGAVTMVPFLDRDTVLLIRQFRYPMRRHFLELPAGKIDQGEEPLATAQRELREECGCTAATWQWLATIHPCIGYSDERIELFAARDLAQVGRALDEGEFLEVVAMPLAQALDWVRTGKITEVKAVIGLTWAGRIAAGDG